MKIFREQNFPLSGHRSSLQVIQVRKPRGGAPGAGHAARQGGHPAERHASLAGGARADAHPCGRGGFAVGQGVGHHQAHVRLHKPHGAAGGAGSLAVLHVGEHPAQAHADHLPRQLSVPEGGRDEVPRRHGQAGPHVADRGARRETSQHGSPLHRRLARRQRRRCHPLADPQGQRVSQLTLDIFIKRF